MKFYIIKDRENKPIGVYLSESDALLAVMNLDGKEYKSKPGHYEVVEIDENMKDEIERLNDELSKERRDNYEKDEEIDALNFRLSQIQQGAYNEGYIVAIKDIKEIIVKCSNGWGV